MAKHSGRPRWRDLPVLLYNIWAALDEIQASQKKQAGSVNDVAKAIDRATDQGNLRFIHKRTRTGLAWGEKPGTLEVTKGGASQ